MSEWRNKNLCKREQDWTSQGTKKLKKEFSKIRGTIFF
jgi:hypothetical protein